MKKLFGVMVLAGFPVACGSTLPSAPDAAQALTSPDAAVSSLSNGRRPVPAPVPTPVPESSCPTPEAERDVKIDGIQVSILSQGAGYVTLRAEAVILHSDRLTPCFTPVWTVAPLSRDASLSVGKDPQVATLVAPAGKYEVKAALDAAAGRRIVGRIKVAID